MRPVRSETTASQTQGAILKQNLFLMIAIVAAGMKAKDVARAVGISNSRMSMLCRGKASATPAEEKELARVLGPACDSARKALLGMEHVAKLMRRKDRGVCGSCGCVEAGAGYTR